MHFQLWMVGGATYRMPTPVTGDLDLNVVMPVHPEVTAKDWKVAFSTTTWQMFIAYVSSTALNLWGETIALDIGVTVTLQGKPGLWVILFRDGKPFRIVRKKEFPHTYCIGLIER